MRIVASASEKSIATPVHRVRVTKGGIVTHLVSLTCLARVVGGDASIEIHTLAQPTVVVRRQGGGAAPSDPSSSELAGAGIRPC